VAEAKRKTHLRERRIALGFTQPAMAQRAGLPLRTYQRLEAGELNNPPIRHVVNCALALGLRIQDIAEPEWISWTPTAGARHPLPPQPAQQKLVETIRAATDKARPKNAAW
jgi:transcriptional regulator with XRE-family HTH domain